MKSLKILKDLVSIVVPAYNAETYLRENVESILEQTYKNIEVIYICDGCTDHTVDILKEYEDDSRLKIIVKNQNEGAAIARNKGMEIATGDWIIFFDSDDLFEKDMIESMLQAAMETKADIVGCYWCLFDESPSSNNFVDNELRKIQCFTYPVINTLEEAKHIIQLVDKGPCTKLVHKSIYQKSEVFFQNIPNANDVYYSMAAVMNSKKIIYVDKVFLHYRSDKGRTTLSTLRNRKKCYIWEACDEVYKYILSDKGNVKFLQSFYNDILFNIFVYLKSPLFDSLIDELQHKYFRKWGMIGRQIEDKLSYINKVIFRKLLANDRNIEYDELSKLAKMEFVKDISKKGCSIWGTGRQGKQLFNDLEGMDIRFRHVFDSAENKIGLNFYGYTIENFEIGQEDNIIITTPLYFEEIKNKIGYRAKQIYNLEKDIWKIP